eukprot:sb/3463915/
MKDEDKQIFATDRDAIMRGEEDTRYKYWRTVFTFDMIDFVGSIPYERYPSEGSLITKLPACSYLNNSENRNNVTFEITIEDIFVDKLTLPPVPTNTVTFSRNFRDFTSHVQSISHEADGVIWHLQVCVDYDMEKNWAESLGARIALSYCSTTGRPKYHTEKGCIRMSRQPRLVVILHTSGTPTIKASVESDTVYQWVVIDNIIRDDADDMIFPKRFDFGRENISVPSHGNVGFTLKDGSSIPLNSYILAYNSRVLKELVEELGEIEHDVSDFEPEAVRIFVDVCYSGTLEKLRSNKNFKVLCDFVKMIAVFKVGWAFVECLEVYKIYTPNQPKGDCCFWDWALLALRLSVKFDYDFFLDHMLSCGPDYLIEFHQQTSELLIEITQRSHLDLVMAVVVEWGIENEFLHDLLTLLKVRVKIPLLKYLLETFNFSRLYNQQKLDQLNVVLRKSFPKTRGIFLSLTGESDEDVKQLLQVDGTLATKARNRWYKIGSSTWPCSARRPFCTNKRDMPELS